MMEQLQKAAKTTETTDTERGLKRNITAITTPNRTTGKYKRKLKTLSHHRKYLLNDFLYRKFAFQITGSKRNENHKCRNEL